jgi:hypothetical protein
MRDFRFGELLWVLFIVIGVSFLVFRGCEAEEVIGSEVNNDPFQLDQ